jgi:hypothetical protein
MSHYPVEKIQPPQWLNFFPQGIHNFEDSKIWAFPNYCGAPAGALPAHYRVEHRVECFQYHTRGFPSAAVLSVGTGCPNLAKFFRTEFLLLLLFLLGIH